MASPRNIDTSLNAKLHQGYDPSQEFKEQGQLLGSVPFKSETESQGFWAQLADGISQSVRNLFNNAVDYDSNNGLVINEGDTALPDPLSARGVMLENNGGNIAPENGGFGAGAAIAGNALPSAGNAAPLAYTNFDGGDVRNPAPSSSSNSNSNNNNVTNNFPPENPELPPEDPPVDPVPPDAPILSAPPASGNEDQPVPLAISITTDPGSITSIIISNIPPGVTLSAGINNGDGTWTLTPAQLTGLAMLAPPNASGNYSLGITVISTENGLTATTTGNISVTVAGVADVPLVSTNPASGNENTAIGLQIAAALTDTDGSETLSIVISDVPNGAVFSAGINNGDGSWTLTPAQLIGLTFTPPNNISGIFELNVTAVASEGNTSASSNSVLTVTVTGVASTPILAVSAASGNEDTAIALNIIAGLTDVTEVLSVVIGDVPNGAILSAGIDNGDGTWTLTAAQLIGLTITPPDDSDVDFVLSVTAISADNGHFAMVTEDLAVTVNAVADIPSLTVSPASGNEDSAIVLNISAALTDNDGSEILSVVVSNMPPGAVLSAGIDNGDGSWTLTPAQLAGLTITPPPHYSGAINLDITAIAKEQNSPVTADSQAVLSVTVNGTATPPILSVNPVSGIEDTAIALNISAELADLDGSETLSITIGNVPPGAVLSAGINNGNNSWTLTSAQLVGLTITPPPNSNNDFVLSVTATSTENSSNASVTANLPVNVIGAADIPVLTVGPVSGNEDSAIALNIAANLTDTDGSESLSVVISNVPPGSILSAGLYAGNNSWVVSAAQLVGLTLTPPQDFNGTLNLTVTAVATENDGDSSSVSFPLVVTVNPVADPPVLTVGAAIGNEDTAISLNIQIAANPSDVLSVVISDVPVGATLSAGINNGNGSWTLTAAQLVGLTITPAQHNAADFNLTVTVTATESDGTISNDSETLSVTVIAVADVPHVLAANVSGAIDTAIALNISGAVIDLDGSESITYVIEGIPDGFALNKGSNNGDNSWTLTPAQLIGLQIISPYHFQGTLNLVAYAVSHEAENGDVERSLPDNFTVTVGNPLLGINVDLGLGLGITDLGVNLGLEIGNILNPGGLLMHEDSPLLLNGLTALLGSILSPLQLGLLGGITISGLPAGVSLSSGIDLGNGSYSLSDLNNIHLIAAPNSDTDFTISLTANLLSLVNISLGLVAVHVIGVADAPTLNVSFNQAQEGDTSIPVTIISALTDLDGSEMLSITLSNLPAGVTPNIGINNADGTWTIPVALLSTLELMLPPNFSGDINFTVTATSTEREGDFTNTVYNGMIHVDPVANAPLISIAPILGIESNLIDLNLGVNLLDNDGSENLVSVIIGGLPPGGILSGGVDNGDGTWTVDPNDLLNLQLTTADHYSGNTVLSVTVLSTEDGSGSLLSTTANIPLYIDATADAPLLSVTDHSAESGALIDLGISSSLIDTDGSETLSVVIGGVPDGFILSAGLNNGNGSWTLSEDQLDNLVMTPPENFIGDVHLSATAYAQETSNGDIASTIQNFTIHIEDVSVNLLADNQNDPMQQSSWVDPGDMGAGSSGDDYASAFNNQ